MLLLDRQSVAATPGRGGINRAQLLLRADGQLLELPPGKTTIGSSPRCNVRIQLPGVQPLHCLIVDGPEGFSVRRWAADTQLNGESFDDAQFTEGDCLVLGGVELELVLAQGQALQHAADVTPPAITVDEPLETAGTYCEPAQVLEHDEQPVDEATMNSAAALEHVYRELQAACATSRGRSRNLLSTLRAERDQCGELQIRCAEFERQLTDLCHRQAEWERSQSSLDQERNEWELRQQEWQCQLQERESLLAEHTRRMNELREELAAARSAEVSIAMPTMNVVNELPRDVISHEAVEHNVPPYDLLPSEAPVAVVTEAAPVQELPVCDWSSESESSIQAEPTALGEQEYSEPELVEREPVLESALIEESVPRDRPWDSVPSIDAELTAGNEGQPEQESFEDDVFGTPAEAGALAAKQTLWPNQSEADSLDESAAVETPEDDNPFAEFSIWKQGVGPLPATFDEPAEIAQDSIVEPAPAWDSEALPENIPSEPVSSAGQGEANPWAAATKASEVAEPVAQKKQPTSFIEQYSHMFADDAVNESPAVPAHSMPVATEAANVKPSNIGIVRCEPHQQSAATADDEESIENYMAKLLQRVRGDAPQVAASQGLAPAKNSPPTIVERPVAEADRPAPVETGTDEPIGWDLSKRRAVGRTPTTDMGALRALANATARRAIGRHEIVKLRRNAVTKVIVSTLAGVTSLWMMLESPDWRSVQFITACVSLLVAAYWAGETFRTYLESLRVAAHDGLEVDQDVVGSALPPALPIDVEPQA